MIRALNDDLLVSDPPTIGPLDCGRRITLRQFERARETSGYVYELIDGVLDASPKARPPHDHWTTFIYDALRHYSRRAPRRISYVSMEAEVVVPGRAGPTRPSPDVAAYRRFPHPAPPRWDDVSPLIVVEVISDRRAHKDTVRNRHLYWAVDSIEEYWIVAPRVDVDRPGLTALRRLRRGAAWDEIAVPFGQTHKSRLLPGFGLNLNRKQDA